MKQTIGIRFSPHGQVLAHVYDAESDTSISIGSYAVAMTDHGLNCGKVVWQRPWQENMELPLREANAAVRLTGKLGGQEIEGEPELDPLPTARPATQEEAETASENLLLAHESHRFCLRCIADRELDMKLVDVEVLFDRSKMIFFFTAPTRVDFRNLVKDLVRQYRTRIELLQIGMRHETQMLGALGNCGMVCCCHRYLHKFTPVTIKMAKDQNLFLNPTKISGICGRLLCCLSYEQKNYDVFHRSCPKLGKRYQTTEGPMRVLRSNIFRNSVVVLPDGGQETELSLEQWQELQPTRTETVTSSSPKEPKKQPTPFMMISASPETLDKDLANMMDLESAPPISHEPVFMDSEESAHHRGPRKIRSANPRRIHGHEANPGQKTESGQKQKV